MEYFCISCNQLISSTVAAIIFRTGFHNKAQICICRKCQPHFNPMHSEVVYTPVPADI